MISLWHSGEGGVLPWPPSYASSRGGYGGLLYQVSPLMPGDPRRKLQRVHHFKYIGSSVESTGGIATETAHDESSMKKLEEMQWYVGR